MNAANAALNPVDPPNEREVPRSTEPSEKAHITHTGREDQCPPKFPTEREMSKLAPDEEQFPVIGQAEKYPKLPTDERWQNRCMMKQTCMMRSTMTYVTKCTPGK